MKNNVDRCHTVLVLSLFISAMLLFCSKPARAAEVSCAEGMAVGGIYYKATSLDGVSISNVVVNWTEGGIYRVSMDVVANQGVKRWYSSSNLYDWQDAGTRNDNITTPSYTTMNNCSSGLVVAAQQTTTGVPIGSGTGMVSLTAGSMGGYKGSNFVLYDERQDGFIAMGKISASPSYAIGITKEDDNVIRKVSFDARLYNLSGVADGNYTVYVTIPIGATTTWFPNFTAYNYWWTTSGRSIPLSYGIAIPVKIRSDNDKPVNPNIFCSMPGAVTLAHGTMTPATMQNSTVASTISVTCNSATTGTVQITGDNNSAAGYATVNLGRGITSNVSASRDNVNWSRNLTSVPLVNGTTRINVRSVLPASGSATAGELKGSAVAIIRYN